MDMHSLRDVFTKTLSTSNCLDIALNQCITEAYRRGVVESNGIVIYTDGYTDTYITKTGHSASSKSGGIGSGS